MRQSLAEHKHALDAPAAVGPYNQAVKVGNLLFASGSLGIDPATGKLVCHLFVASHVLLIAGCRWMVVLKPKQSRHSET